MRCDTLTINVIKNESTDWIYSKNEQEISARCISLPPFQDSPTQWKLCFNVAVFSSAQQKHIMANANIYEDAATSTPALKQQKSSNMAFMIAIFIIP